MKKNGYKLLFALAVLLLVAIEVAGRTVRTESPLFPIAETVASRLIGALVFVPLIRRMGYPVLGAGRFSRDRGNPDRMEWAVLVLSVLVTVNNFPWIGILSGRARITAGPEVVAFFAVECIVVGCFEELAFRGFLLPYCFGITKGKPGSAFRAVFLSSAVFGLVHLVNLFSGASPAAVLMQIGYSFLVGGMCGCVLLATGSVWICAALHAVYNFCGTLLSRYGEGIRWDPVTVVFTSVLAVLASAVCLVWLLKTDPPVDGLRGE